MFLYANGCSMTWGDEIACDPVTRGCYDHEYRIKHAWPNQLKEALNFSDSFNDGKPGGSNMRIVRKTIDWIVREWLGKKKDTSELFVVIGWTIPYRMEIYCDHKFLALHPSCIDRYTTGNKTLDKFYEIYIKNFFNERNDFERTMRDIISLQSFLKVHNIKFLFFTSLLNVIDEAVELDMDIIDYLKLIDHDTFLDFRQHMHGHLQLMGYDKWFLGGHPDEEGHRLWAEYLKRYIDEKELLK